MPIANFYRIKYILTTSSFHVVESNFNLAFLDHFDFLDHLDFLDYFDLIDSSRKGWQWHPLLLIEIMNVKKIFLAAKI